MEVQSCISKPSLEPLHEGKPTFVALWLGVELEFEMESQERLKECVTIVNDTLKDFVILKEDASLGVGFEICSRPASLELHKQIWLPFFNNGLTDFHLSRPLDGTDFESCGMHVHINRSPLSALQVGKMIKFIHSPTNRAFIARIAGRQPNPFNRYDFDMNFRDAKPEYYTKFSKTKGVSLHNPATVEIRIFQGVKDINMFLKNLEFCDALVHFALPTQTSIADSQNPDKFIEFIAQEPSRYSTLIKFLSNV